VNISQLKLRSEKLDDDNDNDDNNNNNHSDNTRAVRREAKLALLNQHKINIILALLKQVQHP
jgi:hypothetical protein